MFEEGYSVYLESYNYILKAIFISAKTNQNVYILQKIRNIR